MSASSTGTRLNRRADGGAGGDGGGMIGGVWSYYSRWEQYFHCIVGRAATISIFADLATPSDEITLTTNGGIMRSLFAFAGPLQI